MKKAIISGIITSLFDGIDQKLEEYEERNKELILRNSFHDVKDIIKQNLSQNLNLLQISKNKDKNNANILKRILNLIDRDLYNEKYKAYQGKLMLLLEFIKLKKYYIVFSKICKKQETFLTTAITTNTKDLLIPSLELLCLLTKLR